MAQVSIRFAAPGTRNYTVGNDVVGGVMKMEAIGAGGAGGTATVNSGGGGKGGAYARRNSQAVVAGQTLTVTVAPSVAAAAGTASTVATSGSEQSVASQTFTYNASTAGATTSGTPVASTIKLSGNTRPAFRAVSTTQETSFTVVAPASAGDYLVGVAQTTTANGQSAIDAGLTVLSVVASISNSTRYHCLFYKILAPSDIGATFTLENNAYPTCVAYSGANAISFIGANRANNGSTTAVAPGFTGTVNDLAVFSTAVTVPSGGAATTVSPSAGVTERIETSQAPASRYILSVNDAPLTAQAGTTILSAAGGNVGGNGSATAGGAGGTAQNGTSVGDVTFTGGNGANGTLTAGGRGGGGAGDASNTTGPGPNTQFGVSRGTGGLSAAAGQVYGGGGGGATTLAARGAGASGIVVLTYSTGTGTISHNAIFNRRITAFRRVIASITHSAVFDRLVTIRRMFTASVTHVSRALKTIKLRKTASVTHVAAYTRKALRLRKTASIVHTPFIRRALRVLRTASIVHTPVFKRLVTLRRRFVASVQHRARMLVKLEARLIPREGGGGTVTNVFRNLFLFDD